MNTKHKLLTFLTALAMLMPLSAVGQSSNKILLDEDILMDRFMGFPYYRRAQSYHDMVKYYPETPKYYGHMTMTKDHFKITIPAHQWKFEDGDGGSGGGIR